MQDVEVALVLHQVGSKAERTASNANDPEVRIYNRILAVELRNLAAKLRSELSTPAWVSRIVSLLVSPHSVRRNSTNPFLARA